MLAIPQTAARVFVAHWPALLAWFLVGYLGRYVAIEFAGFVGGHSATAGLLLLPLAILIRVVSMVAMYLVVRDSLTNLQRIAPSPTEAAARRTTFADATLAAILPFFAVYAAWGMLRDDIAAYSARALEVNAGVVLSGIISGADMSGREVAINVSVNVYTVAIIVIAYSLRWAWKKWGAKLPKALTLIAVYLEAVWVFFSVLLVGEVLDRVQHFVDTRVAMVWLDQLRDTVVGWFAPLAWIWDGIVWFVGEAGGIILLPLAWLTLAGVVYGQAIAPERLRIEHRAVTRVQKGWARVPGAVQRRLKDFWLDLVSRFRPIVRALLLMWRAGPLIIATYVLLYTVVLAAESFLRVGLVRAFGPQDLFAFWSVADTLIFAIVPLVIEPIRTALIAGAYDATLGGLRVGRRAAGAPQKSDAASDSLQPSVSNRKNSGSVPEGETSTENGTAASSGIT